jgi:hypothetical protein
MPSREIVLQSFQKTIQDASAGFWRRKAQDFFQLRKREPKLVRLNRLIMKILKMAMQKTSSETILWEPGEERSIWVTQEGRTVKH